MKVSFDDSEVMAALDDLGKDAYSVARTMAATAAAALRDEAQGNVRSKSGKLRGAIYLAFNGEASTPTNVRYTVSWNRKKAPHGHLVEFGYTQTQVRVQLPSGQWITTKEKLETPYRVPAKPFLRPAYDTLQSRLLQIAVTAGQKRFQALQNGGANG